MLKVNSVTKSFGNKVVFENVSFVVNKNERIGLVGKNGSGKSTLLKIIAGIEKPSLGTIELTDKLLSIGYLVQSPKVKDNQSIEDFLIPNLGQAETEIHKLEQKMSHGSDEKILKEYGEKLEIFEDLGGYSARPKAENILNKLNIFYPLSEKVSHLSGGEKARLSLARELILEPELLLLDEPTNHLDLNSLIWLESFIASFKGALIIISHDRRFLDKTVSRIIEINEEKTIREYTGNYTEFRAQKEKESEKAWDEFNDHQKEVSRIRKALKQQKDWINKKVVVKDNDKFIKGAAKDRATKVSGSTKTLEKKLQALEAKKLKKPKTSWSMFSKMGPAERGSDKVAEIKNVSKSWEDRELLKNISLTVLNGQRIAILGGNGSGKTTLLKILIEEISPDSGTVMLGKKTKIGYFDQEQKNLDEEKTLLEEFLKESTLSEKDSRTFLHHALFTGDEVFKQVSVLSPGEKAKLMLIKLAAKNPNFLILDEPTNHLDIDSLEKIEELVSSFSGTILVVTHDRYFLDKIGITDLYILKDAQLKLFSGTLSEYELSIKKE